MVKNLKVLAFDADDTLWDCQSYFQDVEKKYAAILSPYGNEEKIEASLFQTETTNMPSMGYGCKAFTISLIENAVKISNGNISGNDILEIVKLGKSLLELTATPLPEVVETLTKIRRLDKYQMIVFTKGEILDQENKLNRSKLAQFFDNIFIVSDKTPEEYRKLCRIYDCNFEQLMMVGNSFKSDIEPVLKLGGWAAHIPFHTIWKHEMTTEYEHPKLKRLSHFAQLIEILD